MKLYQGDEEIELLEWWNEALEDNPPLFWIWCGCQFLWRWVVCVVAILIIAREFFGSTGPAWTLQTAALFAYIWADLTCWRNL